VRSWRHLSIAAKLPLGIATLLVLVLGAMGVSSNYEVRRSGEEVAAERLQSVTLQLSQQLGTAAGQRLREIEALAVTLDAAGSVMTRASAGLALLLDSLATLPDPSNEVVATEIWDAEGRTILGAGGTLPVIDIVEAGRLARAAAYAGGLAGRFQIADGTVAYPLILPVTAGDSVVGFLVERRRGSTPESVQRLSEFVGFGARVLFGSPGGGWTDLLAPAPPPPAELDPTGPVLHYTRDGVEVFAHAQNIGSTEWQMLVEFPADVVYAQAHAFLRRTGLLAVFFVAIGGVAGWVASRRTTKPLQRLTKGVEAVAAGRPLAENLRSDRGDEIGRLADAFTGMANEVARSRDVLEERVRERTAALQAANAELEAFSYSVSHDLRAPLRAIDGFSRILVEDHSAELSPEASHCVSVLARNSRQMGQLIDDLLAFSRIGRQDLARGTVDMAALAESVADEVRRAETDRVIELHIEKLPPARGERALLRQVLINLIGNAAKFTRPRDVARIEIGARHEDGETIYYVRDNGVGFDMKYAGKMFGVFQRLHRADEFEGTGVGLAIVQRIVHRHDGRVWSESRPGLGATFYFTLS
jgi:signal transduction histidine kinase